MRPSLFWLLGLAITFGMVVVSAAAGAVVAPLVASAAGNPVTLPALRTWTASGTAFTSVAAPASLPPSWL